MSYKEKPQIKLFKYSQNSFRLIAIIDDYMECSWERNLYEAGQFTISINYNIPNSHLFDKGLFVQFGDDVYDFGLITKIQDNIDQNGKGGQIRNITGFDARYIFKSRVIKNLNSNGLWEMTSKAEYCLRSLIDYQCGSQAENKRKLPIINIIPSAENAIGNEYTVSESFSNLYDVCKTIAAQGGIGWRLRFENGELSLECYEGTDRSSSVQFSPSFDSLRDGNFIDSSESLVNSVYIGGKGNNSERDIYEGESLIGSESPGGFDRFESFDNQSQLTTEDEYKNQADSILTQYAQTLSMSGNGLAVCPYIYKEQYDVGDKIKFSFSNKTANVQILSVTEHWSWNNYEINFSFGKPENTLKDQLQLILRKIQKASNKTNATESVKWYEVPDDNAMNSDDVTFDTIGFTGNVGTGFTFRLYLDSQKTGSKNYNIYFKNLTGTGKLTLTTGIAGASNVVLDIGDYVGIIYVDVDGNISVAAMTSTNTVEEGNSQPVTSGGVAEALSNISGLIPGVILPYGGTSAPDGFLLCQGQFVSRTKYAALFAVIGTTFNLPSDTDVTQFRIPDLRYRFPEGAGTTNHVGTKYQPGLPDIQGSVIIGENRVTSSGGASRLTAASGAFNAKNHTTNSYTGSGTSTASMPATLEFKASSYSGIYGNSNTVQPQALALNYIIKY